MAYSSGIITAPITLNCIDYNEVIILGGRTKHVHLFNFFQVNFSEKDIDDIEAEGLLVVVRTFLSKFLPCLFKIGHRCHNGFDILGLP